MVAKKDFHAPKHPEVEAVPNLHVIKALQVSGDCCHWRIQGGGAHPRVQISSFSCSFGGEIGQNNRSVPLLLWLASPPLGNPG